MNQDNDYEERPCHCNDCKSCNAHLSSDFDTNDSTRDNEGYKW